MPEWNQTLTENESKGKNNGLTQDLDLSLLG